MVSRLNCAVRVQYTLLLFILLLMLSGCGRNLVLAAEGPVGPDIVGPTLDSEGQEPAALEPITLKQTAQEAVVQVPDTEASAAEESTATQTTKDGPALPLGPRAIKRTVDATANNASADISTIAGPVMPDRIVVPAIEMDTGVVELGWHATESKDGYVLSEWDVARDAAGWHKNSSRLGDEGNLVLSGHNNILGAVFRELDRLKKGDEAILWSGDKQVKYTIERVMIVPEKYASEEQRLQNASWIEQSDDTRLTMVSCWPRNDNSHRIIVVAYPAAATSAQ